MLRGSMKSVTRLSLLILALASVSSWAQRASAPHSSVSGHGFGPVATSPSAGGAHPGRRPATLAGRGWCNRGNCYGNSGEWGGYWPGYYGGYGPYSVGGLDPFWELGEPAESQASSSQQPSVIVVREPEQKAAFAPAASPKIIEVPSGTAQGKQIGPSGPVPAAVFILTSGQRLEAKRYLLTENMLQVQRGRDQQNIPMNELNVEATIAANHARGIDLQIPDGKNQLTLGF